MPKNSVSAQDVGAFIDEKAGKTRTAKAVSGRLMEEVVELCLAAGLSTGDIFAHVADALHNQSLKASESSTVFPSQLQAEQSEAELFEEIADVGLTLKDLAYVSGCHQDTAEWSKWSAFKQKQFRVSPQGTLYGVKPHIK